MFLKNTYFQTIYYVKKYLIIKRLNMSFLDNSGDIILDAVLTDAEERDWQEVMVVLKLPNLHLVMTRSITRITTALMLEGPPSMI